MALYIKWYSKSVITVPADVLAPNSARPSADTLLTTKLTYFHYLHMYVCKCLCLCIYRYVAYSNVCQNWRHEAAIIFIALCHKKTFIVQVFMWNISCWINQLMNWSSFLNRRTADVRSVGYSELFVLSRQDVLSALKDHPEAEVSGSQIWHQSDQQNNLLNFNW